MNREEEIAHLKKILAHLDANPNVVIQIRDSTGRVLSDAEAQAALIAASKRMRGELH